MEIKNIKDNIVNDPEFIKLLKHSHYNLTNEKLSRLAKCTIDVRMFLYFMLLIRTKLSDLSL